MTKRKDVRIPPPLRIKCPHPECKHSFMRLKGGFLKEDGTLSRLYRCPVCGESERIIRRLTLPSTGSLPVFAPPKEMV